MLNTPAFTEVDENELIIELQKLSRYGRKCLAYVIQLDLTTVRVRDLQHSSGIVRGGGGAGSNQEYGHYIQT